MKEKYYLFKYMINNVVKMECATQKNVIINLRNELCKKNKINITEMPVYQVDEIPVFNKIVNPIKIA